MPSHSDPASLPSPPAIDLREYSHRHLLLRQRSTLLSELTLGLLHKFNNLFTGVMFLTEESVTGNEAGEPVGEKLQEILNTLQRAHTYVSRIAELHLDEEEDDAGYYDLDAVIGEQLDLARLQLPQGTALAHRPSETRLSFYASRRALAELLLHIVANCGEALPSRGGSVTITTREDSATEGLVQVEIRDNGPGFTPQILKSLFVTHCTTKDPDRHAGYGLIRCRSLAQSFGGDLSARNHPEGGAVVVITLPRDQTGLPPE